jgi:hypothetical protein
MTSLQQVFLGFNAGLSDVQPLMANPGLGAGDSVELSGTAVSCGDVTSLAAKGVSVASDCP